MKNLILPLLLFASCFSPEDSLKATGSKKIAKDSPETFNDYWGKNGAEITSYELRQARYGEIHDGTAVFVYVTEPFSKSKQVKLDNYRSAGEDRVNVLKLNMTKKFLTGIYPYSMMLSTFSPLDGSPMIKSTMTSQEWCGHTFLQLNKQDSGYQYTGFSYFESEGDQVAQVPIVLSEDQLWTQIRLNPELLPIGELELLPSTFYLRLRHQPIMPRRCSATLVDLELGGEEISQYSLRYENRSLIIQFEKQFPHRILGWEETYISGFGNAAELITSAKRINSIRSKYWSKNSNYDRAVREELGLTTK